MVGWIHRLFTPYAAEDDEQTRIANLLHYILLATIGLNLFLILKRSLSAETLWLNAIVLVLQFGLIWLLRQGRTLLTGWLLCFAFWLAITVAVMDTGGLLSVSFNAYVVVILIAGMLLGARAVLGFAFLSVATGFYVYIATSQVSQKVSAMTVTPSPGALLLSNSILFLLLAILMALANRSIKQALRRAHNSENAVTEQNKVLQAEIAERRRADEALRASEEAARAFQQRLKIFNEVTLDLSNAATFDDLCRLAVELGRHKLNFDRLGLWFLEGDHTILGSFGIDEQGNIRDERGIRSVSDNIELIKRAVDEKRLHAYSTDHPLYNHRREVVGQGWNVVAVLWDGDRVTGYLSVDNLLTLHPLTESDLEILTLFGSMLGHLCRRKRAEEALYASEEASRQFQERLKDLYEVSLDLARIPALDDLCRAAVDLGRSKLGFDRLGIWLLDLDDPEYMKGTFGTDESGSVRDERGARLATSAQDKQVFQSMSERASRLFLETAPVYNEQSQVVGTGQKAMAMLSDGHKVIGTISTDNLLRHQPITDQDLEILVLYGSTLGYLCSRKRAEEALLKERNLLRTIIDIIPELIYVKDTDSRLVLVNRASWINTPGARSDRDILGLTDSDFMEGEFASQIRAAERDLFTTGKEIANFEEPARLYGGKIVHFLTTKAPLRDSQGKIIGLVGVSRDITDEKQAEQQRLELALQKERVDLLTEFIGNISHDLKTPLSVIKTSLYLLERMDDPERQEAKIEIIKEQTLRLEKLIQDVITMSRLDHGVAPVFEMIDLNKVIRDVAAKLNPTAERKRLTISLQLDTELPLLMANENELWRLMANLYENALHYTPENGSVTIISRQQDNHLVAEVRDTGIGIGAQDLPFIFDRFYRADPARSLERGGTGLGLAIVQRITQLHQGKIEVESVEGQGTIFRVIF